MVPRVGQRIGPYEILGRLGSGGMGLVFSAWDARLQRDVAIKLLREEYATPTMRSRFLQEARAASGLNHPNICTIFDIGEISGDPFLVMELLKGETLRQRLTSRGKLSAEDIHRIGQEVLDALAMAHARGVIHRDIKPANIILVNKPGGGFQAKVLDFGLAKVELSDEESTRFDLTTIGTTVGTVSYMSPEQARGEAIDARSDLFSLGSVLYEAATGELPFQGATSALIFVELLGKVPAPIRQHNSAIPRDLDRVISRLLAKSRADRFQSAVAALEALQGVSFRRSPLGGLSLWGNKGGGTAKPRPDAPSAALPSPPYEAPPDLSPGSGRNGDSPEAKISGGDTHVRPARRAADPFAARSAHSPAPASPGPAPAPETDRSPATADDTLPALPVSAAPATPVQPAAALPTPPASPRTAAMGTVLLRPVKPDPVRPAAGREPRSPGSSAEARPEESAPSRAGLPDGTGLNRESAAGREDSPVLNTPSVQGNAVAALDGERLFLRDPRTGTAPGLPQVAEVPGQIAAASAPQKRTRRWIATGTAAIVLAAVCIWYFGFRHPAVANAEPIAVALVPVQNGSGDSSLGGVVATGLQFALQQSPRLSIRSAQEVQAGLRATGHAADAVSPEQTREAARAVGASVVASGEIHSEGASYDLVLHLDDVATGKHLADVSETASSREQIAETIDRLASDLRSALGESSDSISRSAVPLSREATSNLDALQAFSVGADFAAAGSTGDAMLSFQRAVSFEPRFTQAYLRLAELYREQHAEVAAARAAAQAQTSAGSGSPRTQALAQAGYATYVAGDNGRAAEALEQLLGSYPEDTEALDLLALNQLLGGKLADAQSTAEHVLRLARYDADAIALNEATLIAQGRPEAVAAVEAQAEAAGIAHLDLATIAAAATFSNGLLIPAPAQPISPVVAATLLDAAGHFNDGELRWQSVVETAHASPEAISTAAYAESSEALHRALAGACGPSLALADQAEAQPSGPDAVFNAGETHALCGNLEGARRELDILTSSHGRSSAVQGYLRPDLAATIAWKSGDPQTALRLLDSARQYDPMSLTAYLRGLVELSVNQPRLSIVQFQAILSHRGPVTLFAPEVYPLAQLGLGRAYAASGDSENSSAAYARFLQLWSTADPNLPAVAEARSHSQPNA